MLEFLLSVHSVLLSILVTLNAILFAILFPETMRVVYKIAMTVVILFVAIGIISSAKNSSAPYTSSTFSRK